MLPPSFLISPTLPDTDNAPEVETPDAKEDTVAVEPVKVCGFVVVNPPGDVTDVVLASAWKNSRLGTFGRRPDGYIFSIPPVPTRVKLAMVDGRVKYKNKLVSLSQREGNPRFAYITSIIPSTERVGSQLVLQLYIWW